MRIAILLLGHGSRTEGANDGIYRVMDSLRNQTDYVVEVGFLELSSPSVEDAVATCVAEGAERVVMIPYFLHQGLHVRRNLPAKCAEVGQRYPHIEFVLGDALGFHPKLAEIVLERVHASLKTGERVGKGDCRH